MVRHVFSKVGMTSIFRDSGEAQGVTLLQIKQSKVLRHEAVEGGRPVVVVSYDKGTRKELVHGWLVGDAAAFPVGESLPLPALEAGQLVKVTGYSKGRGFQDAMTRHGFAGGPGSHGSRFHRNPGSVGMRTEPGRTPKGKRLPGQDGNVKVSVRNLQVAFWSPEEGLLAVHGGVPGARGSCVLV